MNENKLNPEAENTEENSEKFFDEENYHTLLVEENKFKSTKKVRLEDLLELLQHEDRSKKDELLALLKEKADKGKVFLLDAIHNADNEEHLPLLVAACWESGLDFTDYFIEFIHLCIEGDFMTAVEAVTVIDNMEGKLDEKVLSDAINLLQEEILKKNDKMVLLNDLKVNLFERKAQVKEKETE